VEVPKRPRKESTVNKDKAMINIRIETRLNAIERANKKLTNEVFFSM